MLNGNRLVLICVAILAFSSGALGKHREPSGLFLIERDGKSGFIDRAGTVVIEPQFDYANEFYEGLACAKIGDNWFYIDQAGQKVIEFKQKIDHAHDFSDTFVKDGKITQAELTSTRERSKDIINTLKNAPANKIEALVAQYNAELTKHLDKFNAEWTNDYLSAFQDAQIMLGFVTSILAKAGIKEA